MHMQVLTTLAIAGGVVVGAQKTRPKDTSICDWYTTALLKNNTAANQYALVSLVVNTAVIGNYTKPNVGVKVPGILAKGEVNGTAVNLAEYFDGSLASSNRGGKTGVAVNFLDGGGADPIIAGTVASSKSSNQYALLTHLYEYFGALLGCTQYGKTGYAAYTGTTSMYQVHKFMALDNAEVTYFIQQVGLSAASFGVADADVTAVGEALTSLFDKKCAPATAVLPDAPSELQAICIADDCPLADKAVCSKYDAVVEPAGATTGSNGTTGTNGTTGGTGGTNSTGGSGGSGDSGGSGGSGGSGSGGSGGSGNDNPDETSGAARWGSWMINVAALFTASVAFTWLL